MRLLAATCTNLETLSLRGCLVVNDTGILEVAKACSSLKTLNLSFNKKITDSGMKRIAEVLTPPSVEPTTKI